MIYFCCDEQRRTDVGLHETLRGIDYVEVEAGQLQLRIHFVTSTHAGKSTLPLPQPPGFVPSNIEISGGERVTSIQIKGVNPDGDDLLVDVDDDGNPSNGVGDFSIYTLTLKGVPDIDPLLAAVDFSFKVECQSDFDCLAKTPCIAPSRPAPEINYLAKDYASFRQLMLDRMSALMPQWTERNPADGGIALVELLSYVGDHLSYQQDAVATEAYLGTARRRISVRRHARLVDYFMHDGANARAWIQVKVSADNIKLDKSTQLLSRLSNQPDRIPLAVTSPTYDRAMQQSPEVFETMHPALLFECHNKISFYTWGDSRCCLPKGATSATLRDGDTPATRLRLRAGDVLVFVEKLGPKSGRAEDASQTRRHAVRLTMVSPEAASVEQNHEEISRTVGAARLDHLNLHPYVDIEWHDEDALPFPVCISAVADVEHHGILLQDVSVALGNIVLADHGRSVSETLPPVPAADPQLLRVAASATCGCDTKSTDDERNRLQTWPRFRPTLKYRPLTQIGNVVVKQFVNEVTKQDLKPFDRSAAASAAFQWSMQQVLPAIVLDVDDWQPHRDLLASRAAAGEFVVEVEADQSATLRFGDSLNGARPPAGKEFRADYRVGNGKAGNVGADSIKHVVSDDSAVTSVWNPLPARGGTDPESMERVRQDAPSAFRRQERAVTEADYAEVAQRFPGVQRAAATFRWTGSWYTVFLTVDRLGGRSLDKGDFKTTLRDFIERHRLAGYDLEIDGPRYVSLDLALHVCVLPAYFRSAVAAVLANVFSNRVLSDGSLGVFHPDNFTFGQPVYLSRIYQAAQSVTGVESVTVTKFERQGTPSDDALQSGQLTLGRLEIARLDNDPNFRERGVLKINVCGGK